MEIEMLIAIALIMMAAFMFAPLGLGGGVLYVPIFLFLLQWEIHLALVSSLILVWMVSLGSKVAHSKGGYTIKEVGEKGTVAALIGAIFGTILASLIIDLLGDVPIKILASILLVWVLYSTINKFLRANKILAPKLYSHNYHKGIIVIQDFGNLSFNNC